MNDKDMRLVLRYDEGSPFTIRNINPDSSLAQLHACAMAIGEFQADAIKTVQRVTITAFDMEVA